MRVGIIGGGLLGMNLAKLCRKAGYQVMLLEAEPELGGLLRSIEIDGVILDRFYHCILSSDYLLLDLIEELGLLDQVQWKITQTGFYTDRTLYPMNNIMHFLKFQPLNFYERVRLGLCILRARQIKDWRHIEHLTATEWFAKLAGKRVTTKIWNPLLQSKFTEYWDKVNAAYMWGTINRLQGARKGAVQKEALGCIRGGYAPFLKAMEGYLLELGVCIRTETIVQQIATLSTGEIMLDCHHTKVGASQFTFDKVISTLPQNTFSEIMKVQSVEVNKFDTLGMIEGLLLLKRPLSPYYLINITDHSIPFTGIIEYTNMAEPKDYRGLHIIYISRYVNSNSKDFDIAENDIKCFYIKHIKKMFPHYCFNKNIYAFKILKTRFLQPVHGVHHSKKIPAMQTSIKNLYNANTIHIYPWPVFGNETLKLSHEVFQKYIREHN